MAPKKPTPPLSAASKSALIEAVYLTVCGLAVFFAPHATFAFFESISFSAPLTPIGSETLYFRLFGFFGMFYTGFWYAVAGINNFTAFFKCSVYTRCLFLPMVHCALVASGATSTAWLEVAIPGDFLLGLHMMYCLRQDAAPRKTK